ncbi:hypothetical protein RJ639_041865 [Escallonia herrerae]|uniref:Uncharacterized protein n=1 Tax=Escallonia herrerae TaxID=1293975 RepID=A0AA88WIT6_9ASTE|nr:hypothetical protein RJ639_041865 [Escallonia herrerae]
MSVIKVTKNIWGEVKKRNWNSRFTGKIKPLCVWLDITMATSETIPESGPNYILNGLDNALYNVYSPMVNAKALWESLERKYKTEDAGSKKFVVGKFLDFKMVDSKTVISQVQEFQLILHDIHAEEIHKRKEMKLEDLIVRLRIEERIIASPRKRPHDIHHKDDKEHLGFYYGNEIQFVREYTKNSTPEIDYCFPL